nr:MAG TPA: hypothetical protein [Caudoviricetes sp.]
MAKRNDTQDADDDLTTEITASAETPAENTDTPTENSTETLSAGAESSAAPTENEDMSAADTAEHPADGTPVILDYAPEDVMQETLLAVKSRHGAPYRRCGLLFGSAFVIVARAQLPDDGAWARLAADVHLEVRAVVAGEAA